MIENGLASLATYFTGFGSRPAGFGYAFGFETGLEPSKPSLLCVRVTSTQSLMRESIALANRVNIPFSALSADDFGFGRVAFLGVPANTDALDANPVAYHSFS